MNVIDYLLTGIICVYTLLGFLTGLLGQILGIVGIALSLYGGYLFYLRGGNLFYVPLVIIAIAVVFKVIIKVVKSVYLTSLSDSPRISLLSRVGGGVVGLLKGFIFSLVSLISLHFLSFAMLDKNTYLNRSLQESFFYSFLKENSLLPGIGIIKAEDDVNITVDTYSRNKPSLTEETLEELRDNPSFQEILKDRNLLESIRNRDYKAVLSNPKFLNLLKDEDFLNKLSEITSEQLGLKQ